VVGIKLNDGDKVASLDVVQPNGFLLLVTQKGFGKLAQIKESSSSKRGPVKEYPLQNRGTKGLQTLGRDASRVGIIAAARVVSENDDVAIISTNGTVLRSRVTNLPKAKRTSKEPEVMKLKEGGAMRALLALKNDSTTKGMKEAKEEKIGSSIPELQISEKAMSKAKREQRRGKKENERNDPCQCAVCWSSKSGMRKITNLEGYCRC
jgi:DNA gyrase/topoisomerase IV subunit A